MTIPTNCPVQQDTQQIQGLTHDLTKTMRKMRRDVANCIKCSNYEECQVLKELDNMIQQAIQELNDEWTLTQTITFNT
jgi:hypothetical protein